LKEAFEAANKTLVDGITKLQESIDHLSSVILPIGRLVQELSNIQDKILIASAKGGGQPLPGVSFGGLGGDIFSGSAEMVTLQAQMSKANKDLLRSLGEAREVEEKENKRKTEKGIEGITFNINANPKGILDFVITSVTPGTEKGTGGVFVPIGPKKQSGEF